MKDKYFERSMQHPHTLYITSKKTGKVKKCVEAQIGKAQLFMYALTNVKKGEVAYIAETDTKLVTDILEGNENFPTTRKNIYEEEQYVSFEEVKSNEV